MRNAAILSVVLVAASLLWVTVGSSLGAVTTTCSPQLERTACESAVDAVLRRGTPDVRPLILAAHVEPGSAPAPDDLGHRATVTYTLAAIPPTAEVELYYDQGAHWGGRADPAESTVSLLAFEPFLLAVALSGLALVGAWRGRGRRLRD